MKEFEFIEHTADIGVRVFGATKEELFSNAASALFSLITDYHPKPLKEKKIRLAADNLEDLFVAWLSELISQLFADRFLSSSYDISFEEGGGEISLNGVILGEPFDPFERKIKTEIKAATYHNLKIEKTEEGYATEVIFDV